MSELKEAASRYLTERGASEENGPADYLAVGRFLTWLDNNELGPASARVAAPTRPSSGSPGAGAVPEALRRILERWVEEGRPRQRPIPWPRERWVAMFPEHAEVLEALPNALDRDTVRSAVADPSASPGAAERAFVIVMAWGFGKAGYGPFRTRRALDTVSDAGARLQQVAETLSSDGAVAAYARLGATEDARLRGLGPAFGTKFLYFAQASGLSPAALIFDETVASWLAEQGTRLRPTVWSVRTYRTYLERLHEWAHELGVSAEDVEYVIFLEMARRRGTQWAD